jgi:hypothetical protein
LAVSVSGALNQSGYASASVHTWFFTLVDGALSSEYTTALGIYGWADAGQNYHEVGFRHILKDIPSAASHNVCVGMVNDSGRTLVFDNTSFTKPFFQVEEVK